MINFYEIFTYLINIWHHIEAVLEPYLKNLDPSLFQNIIIGILAVFIPFAIVFLTDILGSKKERSEFEKMVLSVEVLGAKKIFWLSILGIGILSFFSGKDIVVSQKIIAILITLIIIFIFGRFFKRTLRFSEGYKPEFEVSFLKSLNLSRIFIFGNKLKMDRLIRAWNSFWSEKSAYNEKEYTNIFISQIDKAIKQKKFSFAIELSKAYVKDIEKRDLFSIGYDMLPKVFEWNEIFWEEEQYWLTSYAIEKKIQEILPQKYLPTFQKWALSILKKIYHKKDYFWNWNYFENEFLPAIVKILLNDGHEPFQFFTAFKKHIDECEERLDKIPDGDRKERYWNYIKGIIASFCKTFFESINVAPYKFDIWEHYFPKEWKITMENSEKRIPRIFLDEFQRWTHGRIFDRKADGYDDKLSEVAGGLFPSVHSSLFPAFLILLYSPEIKYAIEKESTVFLVHGILSWSGDKSQEEISKMMSAQEMSQKEETIKIIYTYFWFWGKIKIYTKDLTEEENSKWKEYNEEERKTILKRVRKHKLQKMKNELESSEIKEICKDSKEKESRKVRFLELVSLLIGGVNDNT